MPTTQIRGTQILDGSLTGDDIQDYSVKLEDLDPDIFSNIQQATKVSLGLDQVDNTSDLNKPISIAVQNALDNISLTPPTYPGSIRETLTGTISSLTGTTKIPYNNVAPVITQGAEIWSRAITPSFTNSKIGVNFSLVLSASDNNSIITVALFRDSTLVTVSAVELPNNASPGNLNMLFLDSPNSTENLVYSVRVGINKGSWYVNSNAAGNNYGNKILTSYRLDEIVG